jgi:hypothetical protein
MEETIGFDLRSAGPVPDWTADRRKRHLLRRDVPSVRSVDSLAWPQPPGLPPSPEFSGLWPSLSELLVAAHAVPRAGIVAVQITAVEQDEPAEDGVEPTGTAAGKRDLLGFDVADYDLFSGLTNCGYKPDEAASLAPVWAPRLNQWHLFDNPDHATAYASVTADRVPEHAPFYAYGIYQLDWPSA